MTQTNLFSVADNMAKGMSLFRAGFKAEVYWGDEIVAHHMNTRSVYRFKKNSDIAITHSAKYVDDGTADVFSVSVHEQVDPLHGVTKTVGTFDNWLSAYYFALETIRKNSK